MKKVIKLSETDLKNIIRVALKEAEHEHNRYMFFSNLEQMKRQAELLLDLDSEQIHSILENGHDWADDHITVAKENLDQVFDFMMNEINGEEDGDMMIDDIAVMEGRKKQVQNFALEAKRLQKLSIKFTLLLLQTVMPCKFVKELNLVLMVRKNVQEHIVRLKNLFYLCRQI